MSAKQKPIICIQKCGEFGAAVKEKGCDSVACENARDFIDTFTKRMGGIVNIAATVAKRDSARDFVRIREPGNQNCLDAVGLELFANIDTTNLREGRKVTGDLVVECFEKRACGQYEGIFTKTVKKEQPQPGEATCLLFNILVQQDGQDEGRGASSLEVG